MKQINISFKVDPEEHSKIKKAAESQNKTLPKYFLELHNNFIQGRKMIDSHELLREIHKNTKLMRLLQPITILFLIILILLNIIF